jgi:hypothetical protein
MMSVFADYEKMAEQKLESMMNEFVDYEKRPERELQSLLAKCDLQIAQKRQNISSLMNEKRELESIITRMVAERSSLGVLVKNQFLPSLDTSTRPKRAIDAWEHSRNDMFTRAQRLLDSLAQAQASSPRRATTTQVGAPHRLYVKAGRAAECAGWYDLVGGITCCDYPVWKKADGDLHLFACFSGLLIFGNVDSFTLENNTGLIASTFPHNGAMPHDIKHWQRDDGVNWIIDNTISASKVDDCEYDTSEIQSNGTRVNTCDTLGGTVHCRAETMLDLPSPSDFMKDDDSDSDFEDDDVSDDDEVATQSLNSRTSARTMLHLPPPSDFLDDCDFDSDFENDEADDEFSDDDNIHDECCDVGRMPRRTATMLALPLPDLFMRPRCSTF